MASVCLYFKVHQPFQLRPYHSKDIDVQHCYEDAVADRAAINELADACYLPANSRMLSIIAATGGKFKLSYSISGTALELLERYRPDVIGSFQELAATGCVEILAETYYQSLSSLYSLQEFKRQVDKHCSLVKRLFGVRPEIFRNTELIHNNALAGLIGEMGFKGILCEGIHGILRDRSCNRLYRAPGEAGIKLLLRNPDLSDDIAFRFDDVNWSEHPLTAEKFAGWIHEHPAGTEVINLFLDYETLGVHKKAETGIFDFLQALPGAVLADARFRFSLPGEVIGAYDPIDIYDAGQTVSWENRSGASSAWGCNLMQNNTFKKIYSLEKLVLLSGNSNALDSWGKLQTADHFYYMADDPHPIHSAKDVYQYYINIAADLEISLIRQQVDRRKKKLGLEIGVY